MNAKIKQDCVIYHEPTKERFLIVEGDKVDVIWKEEIRSKIRFLDGEAEGTTHVIDNVFLDFETE